MSADNFDQLCEQGRQAVHEQHVDQAVELYSQAVAMRPDDPAGHEGLATVYFMQKDFDHAIEQFQRVTQLRPRDVKAFINLGALYNLKEEYKKATDILRKAIQRDPKSADAYYNLGIAEKHLGQVAMAINSYRECLRLKPDMAQAHQNIANCYVEQKNYKKATEHFEKALEHRPGFGSAQRGLKHVKALQEEAKQAASPFGRLVDASKIARRDEQVAVYRVLTENERFADRQLLQLSTEQQLETAEGLWRHLGQHLEPALLKVSRIMMQRTEHREALFTEQEAFQHGVQYAKQLFALLQAEFRKMQENEASKKS